MFRTILAAAALCCLLLTATVRAENPRGQYFYRDGVELYAETTYANTGNPTMIFIHGSGGNAAIFRGQVDRFARKYSTIAFDLRGSRYSNNTATGFAATSNFNFVEWSDDVHYVLQQLGVQQVICVGGNYGANVCLQLEHDHSDTIDVVARVRSGGNMLTVGLPSQWPYIEISPPAHSYICSLINGRDSGPAGEAAYNYFLATLTCGGVYSDQCDNMAQLCQTFVVADSWAENKALQMRKLGCFGQNPNAWVFVDQSSILPALALRKTPEVTFAGAENLPFSRGYVYRVAEMLLPPDSVRPAGRSTPIVRTLYGRSIFAYATDVDLFNSEVEQFLKYVETGTQLEKCDVLKA